MSRIRLVVQSDDFGMCHAVNEGVERAFAEGILTQASIMAPCPWFAEAADIAIRSDIPVGVHLTLTCEWDHLRWSPLSGRPSLYAEDRTFHRTVPDAVAAISTDDATEECLVQTARAVDAGLEPTYFDPHMGLVDLDAYRTVCRTYDRPFLYPALDEAFAFDSIVGLMPEVDKIPWMVEHLASLTPGTHMILAHVAEAGSEIDSITRPDSPVAPWAGSHRASDLAALVAPEVREAIEERGITLTSLRELRTAGAASRPNDGAHP